MRRPTRKAGKGAARREVAAALRALAAARRVQAAEVGHLARVLGVLANEVAGAAGILGTELAALRLARGDPEAPAPVRRIGRRP